MTQIFNFFFNVRKRGERREMSKRKLERDIPKVDRKRASNIIDMIVKGGLDIILNTIMALLRDRPVTLINIYDVIFVSTHYQDDVDHEKVQLLQNFLKNTFKTLWFLSYKINFPLEIICAFEYDYYVKNLINFKLDDTDYKKWQKPFAEIGFTLLFFYSDIGNDMTQSHVYRRAEGEKLVSAFIFYNDIIQGTLYQNVLKMIQNDKSMANRNINKGYVNKATVLLQNYFKTSPENYTDVFQISQFSYGFHAKMRRILYIIIHIMIDQLNQFFSDCMILISNIDKDSMNFIKDSITKSLKKIGENYLTEVSKFSDENEYNQNMGIIDINKKAEYFNFFNVFKELDNVMSVLPSKQEYSIKIINLIDDLYNKFSTDLLINIIINVEKDIDIDDDKPFRLFFQDYDNEDRLLIDYKSKFAWFYSYYNTVSKELIYLNIKDINKFNEDSSFFWYVLLDNELQKYAEKERIMKFSSKK